jgi:hypothetical protein
MTVKGRAILTPAQSTQQALDIERERYRSSPCLKDHSDTVEKQEPTSDAVTALHSEDRRYKVNYRSRKSL